MRRFAWWVSIAAWVILAGGNSAQAQGKAPSKDDKEQQKSDEAARVLFDAGARAYAAGLYADAVTAFREAHALSPDRPTVLFSMAQAERRQYAVTQEPEMLAAAIAHFRKYLEVVPEGGRRGDVVVALGELEASRGNSSETAKKPARIFITTETPAAVIYIDGVKRNQVPVIEEAAPGNHEIKIEAPGFVTESREIVAVEGAIFPLEVNLEEKPSFLALKAPTGASITVDGRVYGDAPLQSPLELTSGSHRLVVTQRGHIPYDQRISIERAWTSSLNVALESTTQRRVSYVFLGTALVGFGASAALIAATFVKDAEAFHIYEKAKDENINGAMLSQYIEARDVRNVLAGAAIGTTLFAVGVGVAAGATYWFDSSSTRLPGGPMRSDARISVTPTLGGAYVSVGARF